LKIRSINFERNQQEEKCSIVYLAVERGVGAPGDRGVEGVEGISPAQARRETASVLNVVIRLLTRLVNAALI